MVELSDVQSEGTGLCMTFREPVESCTVRYFDQGPLGVMHNQVFWPGPRETMHSEVSILTGVLGGHAQ